MLIFIKTSIKVLLKNKIFFKRHIMTKDKLLSHKEMFEFLTDSYYSEEEVSLKLKKEIENTLFKESPKYSFLYIDFLFKYAFNDGFVSYVKPVEAISFHPDLSYDYLKLLLNNNVYLPNKQLKQLIYCINGSLSTQIYNNYHSNFLIIMLNNKNQSEDFIRCFSFIYNFNDNKECLFRYILINKITINKKLFQILEGGGEYFSCYMEDLPKYGSSKKYINFFNSLKNQ